MQQERTGSQKNDTRNRNNYSRDFHFILDSSGKKDPRAEKEARQIFAAVYTRLANEHCIKCEHFCRPTHTLCRDFHLAKLREWLLELEVLNGGNAYDEYWNFMQAYCMY